METRSSRLIDSASAPNYGGPSLILEPCCVPTRTRDHLPEQAPNVSPDLLLVRIVSLDLLAAVTQFPGLSKRVFAARNGPRV